MLVKWFGSIMIFSFLSATGFADTTSNWVINPNLNVGEITKNSTEKDLIRHFEGGSYCFVLPEK